MKFNGYVRPDGRLGIRNKVLIVALDECCDGLAKRIAQGCDDAVVLTNHYTCMLGGNEETFYQMAAVCANPKPGGCHRTQCSSGPPWAFGTRRRPG